jgi:ubiquitin thioesterase protein OTUB1
METLLELHDEKLLQDEITRMRNLTNYVVESGYELWIFEDMRDECLETLQACTTLLDLPASQAEAELLRMFNKQDTSDAIVYWLRLLTCAHFREHAARFEPYVPELAGVDAYCKENLEPPYTEIEHLGLTALMEVLLDPIGVGVQINYLDRTPGPEMNHYNLAPKSTARSTIQLLYRPGHYDLLYKISEQASARRQMSEHQILNAASAQSNMQVNRATSFSQQHQIQSTPADYYGTSLGYLLSLPQLSGPLPAFTGFQTQGFVPESTPYGLSSQTASSYSMDYPKSMSPEAAAPTPDNLTQLPPASITSLPPIDVRPLTLNTRDTTISLSPLSPTTITNPTKPRLQSPSANTPTPTLPPPLTRISSHDSQQSQFRPSMYQYKDDWGEISAHQQPVFQTSTFKNSHYNVSHYNNPNFQPEVWTPGQEGEERDERGRSGRRGTS